MNESTSERPSQQGVSPDEVPAGLMQDIRNRLTLLLGAYKGSVPLEVTIRAVASEALSWQARRDAKVAAEQETDRG